MFRGSRRGRDLRYRRVALYLCGGESPVSEYPLGLAYLRTTALALGANVDILRNPSRLSHYDLVGLSSNAWGVAEAVQILDTLNVPVAIGGQATLWEGLRQCGFRHIVVGEGEAAFGDILRGAEDRVLRYAPAADIDRFPFPDRGRCDQVVPILSSRGCPYTCRFCSSRVFWQKARFHSPEYFIDEVDHLAKRYPRATVLYILDDLFISHKPRLREIHRRWMSRGHHRRFEPRGFVRSGVLDPDTAQIMKEMGFRRVRFGAESGSDRMLDLLGKGATVAQHQETIETALGAGLEVSASFMHSLPGETDDDRRLTEAFLERNRGKLHVEGSYTFKAFPGTEMWDGADPCAVDLRVR
ncbi:MAG: B12-binding domain-containing radical SAM protein [Planctomycetota bacterium]